VLLQEGFLYLFRFALNGAHADWNLRLRGEFAVLLKCMHHCITQTLQLVLRVCFHVAPLFLHTLEDFVLILSPVSQLNEER